MRAPLIRDPDHELGSNATAWELWTISVEDGQERLLFSDPHLYATRPDWSWASGRIAFTGISDDWDSGGASLWTLRDDGTEPTPVPIGTSKRPVISYPSWFPDGRRVAVTDYQAHRLLAVDTHTGEVEPLTDPGRVSPGMSSVSPSVDHLIAFAGQRPSRVYDPRRNTIWIQHRDELFQLDPHHGRMPAWSPDGKLIAFASTRPRPAPTFRVYPRDLAGGKSAIHVRASPLAVPGHAVPVAVGPYDVVTAHAKWAPDGTRLVCMAHSLRTGARGLAMLDLGDR